MYLKRIGGKSIENMDFHKLEKLINENKAIGMTIHAIGKNVSRIFF